MGKWLRVENPKEIDMFGFAGVYVLIWDGSVLYIGSSGKISMRLRSHFKNVVGGYSTMWGDCASLTVVARRDTRLFEHLTFEARLIAKLPSFGNIRGVDETKTVVHRPVVRTAESKTKKIQIRVSPDMYDKIRAIAGRENITISRLFLDAVFKAEPREIERKPKEKPKKPESERQYIRRKLREGIPRHLLMKTYGEKALSGL